VLLWVSPAVAQAALDSGVARLKVDLPAYRQRLQKMQSRVHQVMATVFEKARKQKVRIVLDDGEHPRVLQAAHILREEALCEPVLLGNEARVRAAIEAHHLGEGLAGVRILDPLSSADSARYVDAYFALRQRHGVTRLMAEQRLQQGHFFGSMAVELGDAEGLVTGLTRAYAQAIHAPLEIIRTQPGKRAGGIYLVVTRSDFKFFADCTVNCEPSAAELADIGIATADLARSFDVTPRVAFLSYSNYGDAAGASPARMRKAVELARARRPDLEIDGEMQVDVALVPEEREGRFPFTHLKGDANVLVFPSLDAANIAYKVIWRMGAGEVIGPLLLGMNKPVNVLQQNADVPAIVNLAAVTALRAQGGDFIF
jgi:malate dehydrogenase (oxaloacetate-decarboxylating)(NADP+)